MHHFFKWIQTSISRRGFFGVIGLALYHFALKGMGWAKVEYIRVKEFLIRSIEGTQRVDLKT